MTRYLYGGTTGDWTADVAGRVDPGTPLVVATAPNTAAVISDITAGPLGSVTAGVVTSDGEGAFSFYGPDGHTSDLWARAQAGGTWRRIGGPAASAAVQAAVDAGTVLTPAAGDATYVALAEVGEPSGVAAMDAAGDVVDAAGKKLARQEQTVSLDELSIGWNVPLSITTAISYPIFIAPYPLSVEQFALCTFGAAIPTSDANYWTIELRRVRNNVTVVIATKTTKTTPSAGVPGEAMPARGDWNFDQATFDPANKQLLKGDIVSVAFVPTGAVTNIGFPGGHLRYVPSA